ncbi:Flp pilus assembly protein CpaB [Sutcliffiella rhizosphaerae]|uniref:SAF domain-containing protein n=1 Tax=Sutcliffiella rhizosphaerae TaxID=2880967 RepID=A0ABN8A591_9BACI|nr:SAF domain-containing protein [Sutcliffiella rhizosphaerae]CAG9620278.1 hypothetical protein BACCIP111883_01046 [Sutcliffiella rhizosphaerae]
MLESKRRAIIFLTLSLLLAVAAGFLFLQKVSAINTELGGMTKVYIAAENIPSRAVIQPNQVTTTDIPNRFVNESHITDVSELANRVSVVPLSEGELITSSMIKPIDSIREENNRIVTISQTERVRFDERLEALDRVDIIVSHKFDGDSKTEIFMTDVLVAGEVKSGGDFSGIAVEINSEDAPKLIHMQNYADSIRILKANVGNGNAINDTGEEVEEVPEEEIVDEETNNEASNEEEKIDDRNKEEANKEENDKEKDKEKEDDKEKDNDGNN